jgi:cytochrome c oxidase subunit 2
VDACPGRLNQVPVYIKRTGFFYGQCSELCGVLHGFMPIAITAVDFNQYFRTIQFHMMSFDVPSIYTSNSGKRLGD